MSSAEGSRLALVFGAGASWASPAARPMFAAVQRSLFSSLGLSIDGQRARLMAPEALLSRLAGRGVDINSHLRTMLTGGQPNALHFAAAEALRCSHPVWTPNFDELIEEAARRGGVDVHRLLPADEPDCQCGLGHLVKVHGTLGDATVLARSEDVLEPLGEPWTRRMRDDFGGADVAIVGYAGADLDLRVGLRDALRASHSARWFDIEERTLELSTRFQTVVESGQLRLQADRRPDLAFLDWASAHGLTQETPSAIDELTRGDLPDVADPAIDIGANDLLRGLIADDFGDVKQARRHYRAATVHGPERRRAARSLFSTGLIHGAVWRPAATALLNAVSASPLPWRWPHQQFVLYLTWNGHTAEAWRAAQRAAARFPEDRGARIQAANLAKECDPAHGVRLARLAQQDALSRGDARSAAWATLCLSLSLRWVGAITEAAQEAARLADGLDALAGPVWRAWGQFELGAVATLRDDAKVGIEHLRRAREVFTAAGATNFVFDAICAELAATRQQHEADVESVYRQARAMIDDGLRTSRFAREVLLVEEGEIARADGRLDDAAAAYRQLADSPTVAQAILGLLGLGEVQRARGEPARASRDALRRSRELGFGYGEVHAAVTLGLTGEMDDRDVEATLAASAFDPPTRTGAAGLERYCLGPRPSLHAMSFP